MPALARPACQPRSKSAAIKAHSPCFAPSCSFRSYDLSSLRTGIMAGSPCPVAVMRKVQTGRQAPLLGTASTIDT